MNKQKIVKIRSLKNMLFYLSLFFTELSSPLCSALYSISFKIESPGLYWTPNQESVSSSLFIYIFIVYTSFNVLFKFEQTNFSVHDEIMFFVFIIIKQSPVNSVLEKLE